MSPIFVVQKHAATRLHYDIRFEHEGVLKSWAVPKTPPRRAGIKRLAMQTEDHALSYANFQGTIAEGSYGAGTVEIWDTGTFEHITQYKGTSVPFSQALQAGKLELLLAGGKLRGGYVLVRTSRKQRTGTYWLFFKMKEETVRKKRGFV